MSTEISQNRKALLLYLLDVVLFAFVVSALFWVFQVLVPESYLTFVIIVFGISLAVACWITFRLIVSSPIIDAYIPISLLQDMKEGTFVYLSPNSYELSRVAAEGFADVCSKENKYKKILHEPLGVKAEIWKDFWIYAIVDWLTRLSSFSVSFQGYRRQPSKVLTDWIETKNIPDELKRENLFLKNVETLIPIKTLKFQCQKDKVLIKYSPMKISISFTLTSWIRGPDLRIMKMLELPSNASGKYATISGFIRFKAEFGATSIFYRKSDKYYVLAKQLLENMRENYDWNEYLDDLKDYFYWKHVCNS